jgi:integrase
MGEEMATKTRGQGEGSLFKDSRGLWNGVIELPSRDGKRRRKTIRSTDKDVVMQRMRKLQRELEENGDLHTADMTVGAWFSYWYTRIVVQEVRPKTAADYKTIIDKHVLPVMGTKRLAKLTPSHIREVTDRMVDNGGSPTSALKVHRVMSASFEAAVREGRIPKNPCEAMRAPRKSVAKLETLTGAEALYVFAKLREKTPPEGASEAQRKLAAFMKQYGARYGTAMLTGARRGELLGLEYDRVTDVLDLSWQLQRFTGPDALVGNPRVPSDYEYRHLYGGYYLTRPKSKAGWRIVPIIGPLQRLLADHINDNPAAGSKYGLVFARNNKPADPDWDSKTWKALLLSWGITKNVRLHDLRHGAVDMLYKANVPEDIISALVGHSTVSMTRAYQSRDLDRLRAAMTQFGDHFTQLGDSHSGTLEQAG